MKWLGLLAIALYAVHGGYHLLQHRAADLLWACHMATLAVGVGCLAGSAPVVTVGLSLLVFGLPLWVVDMATGGELLLTSIGTHVGGLVVGVLATRQLGWPEGTWWKAVAVSLVILLVTRLLTPAPANINLVFAVAGGWERWFPSHRVYLAGLVAASAGVFFMTERAARSLLAR